MTLMQTLDKGGTGSRRGPFGGFLDRLPAALYALAHIGFLAAGLWLWWRANDAALPYSGALLLFAAGQLGFLAYFAKLITMKMAVLVEQTLVLAMITIIVLRTV